MTLLVSLGCVALIYSLINKGGKVDPNPFSNISSDDLANKIMGFIQREGCHLIPLAETKYLASEAIAYEEEPFSGVDRVVAYRTDSMTVITWIVGQDGAAEVAHVRQYGSEFDLSAEKLFIMLRPLVTYSSAGGPPLSSQKGEQAGAGQPATAPESRPERKKKPKPESEVRPQ